MFSSALARYVARTERAVLAGLLMGGVLGCGSGSPYELAPVHGRLTVKQRPLAGAKVMFAPIAKDDQSAAGKPAVGLTDSEGSFTLTTYSDGDGAVVGEHWITVFAPEAAAPNESAPGDPASTEPKYKRLTLPQKQVVAAGQENAIDIAL
jgi:hypothetical protein